jgi:VanZ family protein
VSRAAGWGLFVLLILVQVQVLYLTTGTGPPPFPHADKLVHAAVFAAPAAVATAVRSRWALGLLVVHALASEPLQAWTTTTRQADVWDTVADLVGIVLGVVVMQSMRRAGGRP